MASTMAERAGPPASTAATRRPSTLSEIRRSVRSRLRHLPSPSSSSHPHLRDKTAGVEGDDSNGYDIQAELVSRDKARQKEAVRRYLQSKVRNDWSFEWPPRVPPPAPAAAATVPKTPTTVEGTLVISSTSEAVDMDVAVENASNGHHDVDHAGPSQQQQPQNPVVDEDNDNAEDTGVHAPAAVVEVLDAVETDEPIDSGAEADSDTESIYSIVSEDPSQYRPRAEWTSDISDDDGTTFTPSGPAVTPSPFRFDSPDSVGFAVQATSQAGREKRRRADREEMAWNEGLACFNARRDAWTGARTVRLKPRPLVSPTSPTSPRRRDKLFRFRSSHGEGEAVVLASPTSTTTTASSITTAKAHPTSTLGSTTATTTGIGILTPPAYDGDSILSPVTTNKSHSVTTTGSGSNPDPSTYPIETILPVPPPLLPPNNPMRASITPALYLSIYDKVVAAAAQPSCPINLSDMIRSCVAAWKRDGEWPPRPSNMMGLGHDPMMTGVMMPNSAGVAAAARARRRVEKEREQRRQEVMRREAAAVAAGGGAGGGGGGGGHGRRMSFAGLIGRRNSAAGVEGTEGGGGGGGANNAAGEEERSGIRKSFRKILHIGHHAPAPAAAAAAAAPGAGA
ncbi:hypothetical protein PpBr36_08065 [Pyricularia pennisetigena]|uniref:hypothetical protein n=1 Tax=Pyricularia pennisetigena TaxID=1578925 RepID=UPI00114ECFBB|nr:hypothetical protein PpBr36_08065 [Pyricularia pennisetigena]TLS24041.1 hypothetical protein PpBr36_08065 [Pyricularia pennisetigena]